MSPVMQARKSAKGQPAAAAPPEQDYDLEDVFRLLRRRAGLIIATVLVVTTGAGLVARSLTPVYTARSTIVVEPRETHVISFDETQKEVPADISMINTHVKFLTSNSFAWKVIERLQLIENPEFNSILHDENATADTHPFFSAALSWAEMPLVAIGLAHQASSAPRDPQVAGAPGNGLTHGVIPTSGGGSALGENGAHDAILAKVTEAFLSRLDVGPSGQSYAISVDFTSTSPDTAARVANTVAQLYVERQLESKQVAAAGALDWLTGRLNELRDQLVESERAAEQYRAENELALSGNGIEFNDEELTALTQELITAQAERVTTEAKLSRIRQVRGSREALESIPEVMMSPIIADLRQQEMEILRTEAQLRQEYGPRHPMIIQIEADKEKLAARVDAETRNIIASLANEVATIQAREQTLQERLAHAKAAAAADSQAEIPLRILEGDAESTRALYTMLLDRFKELTAERELLEPGVRVISAATVPDTPSAPQTKLIIGAGFMSSLMLGTLLAFVRDRLDRGLRTGHQAEVALNLPQIGLVPKLGAVARGGAHRYLIERPTSAYAEAIRGVQTALYFSNAERPPQVVLVTSSVPGEGKTTLAISLATLLAQSGCRTVAVDLDLRRPNLGCPTPGNGSGDLVDFLSGRKGLEDILHQVSEAHSLDMIPGRRLATSPTDLLASRRMAFFIAELRDRYDYIVLDSPPLLGLADSRFAARLADAVVFVVRWSKTGEAVARKALDTLRDSDAPLAGVVLNQVDVRRHRKYDPEDVLPYYGPYRKYYLN